MGVFRHQDDKMNEFESGQKNPFSNGSGWSDPTLAVSREDEGKTTINT